MLLLGLGFCAGVAMGWWDEWFRTETLRNWWFYLLVFAILLYLRGQLFAAFQRGLYARQRDELLSMIAAEHFDRDRLLPLVEGDPSVSRLTYYLKLDTDVPVSQETPQLPGPSGA
jgi:hypothetical protein